MPSGRRRGVCVCVCRGGALGNVCHCSCFTPHFNGLRNVCHPSTATAAPAPGGAFVLAMPKVLHLDGIVPQIMGLPEQSMRGVLQRTAEAGGGSGGDEGGGNHPPRSYPPTFFQHMARDRSTAAVVARNIELLREQVGRGARALVS